MLNMSDLGIARIFVESYKNTRISDKRWREKHTNKCGLFIGYNIWYGYKIVKLEYKKVLILQEKWL